MVGQIQRNTMDNFFINVIANYINSYDSIQQTILKLPVTTTKSERYSIHRLTTNGFVGKSYDQNEDRIMEITLSKEYVKHIFLGFIFQNDTVVDIPLTDKQVLLNSLIGFINQNLQNEFRDYLNNV